MEEQLIIAVQGFPELYDLSSPHYFDSNMRNNAESAADGCLATTDASGAQPPERFGKKEKAVLLAFSTRGYACNHGSLRVGNETLRPLGVAMGNAVSVTRV